MSEGKVPLRTALAAHLRAGRELSSVSPRFFAYSGVLAVFSALLPYATVFFSARILQELATQRRETVLWQWVLIGVICAGALAILKAVFAQRVDTLRDDLWERKELLFMRKLFSLDYADIDKQQTHDLRAQIQQNENWGGWGLMLVPGMFNTCLESAIGIVSGAALTVSLFTCAVPESAGWLTALNNPVFALALIGVMIGISLFAGYLTAKAERYLSSHAGEATESNRLFSYFGFISLKKERGVDMRMYAQQRLIDAYWSGRGAFGVDGVFARLARGPMGVCSGLSVAITALITGFVYVFTCLKAWGGAFDIGSVTQYVGAATALAGNTFAIMNIWGTMQANTTYLNDAFRFLDMPNAMYQGSLTTEKRSDRQYEVEFRHVSFKYPASELWALRDVSMKFKVGSRLAIVGENGSGKTTFIKLLCRLYDPQEGQILLNGIDIRKYRYDDYMGIFSVVFQDFQLISQPLGNNVAGSMRYDEARVRQALIDAGFGQRLAAMPEGLDTQLYKDFAENGVEVSGGEAQKIAIARALYKDAPFIILDEPTAALDPVAEAEIYSKFDAIAGDKTAIYISHRLSSCKFCDEIAVFDGGRIIQQGTHAALLADKAGKYFELWNAQAQYYSE